MDEPGGTSLEHLVRESFLHEIRALKPGNVSQYAGGHGMSYDDFVISADVSTPHLCNAGLGVGERVLKSVEATSAAVGCNTNLGMLLLFSPVVKSYETKGKGPLLRENIRKTLYQLDSSDAEYIYQAIRLANPGGLGRVEQHDVNFSPNISLLEAMGTAADRDLIARQYVADFEDVYKVGLNRLSEFDKSWNSVEWATVACYLSFMASYPDSHIRRKHGDEIALRVRLRAAEVFKQFKKNNNPVNATADLLEFDKELKNSNINPGTCADLTAVSLLIYALTSLD